MADADKPDVQEAQRIKFYQAFKELAGDDEEIDAWELQEVLNNVMKRDSDLWESRFSLDSCRSMVAMSDNDCSGKLNFEEFLELWRSIMAWKSVFKRFDRDNSGHFDGRELYSAMNAIGYKLDRKTFKGMVLRYSDKKQRISFDNFIAGAAKLRHMNHVFNTYHGSESEKATFGLDQYLRATIYS